MSFKYFYCKLLFYIFLSEVTLGILAGIEADDYNDDEAMSTVPPNLSTDVKTTYQTTPIFDTSSYASEDRVTRNMKHTTDAEKKTKKTTKTVPKYHLPLKNCTTFDTINFSNRKMPNISADAFQACPKLTRIDLSRNQLSTLPPNIFQSNLFLKCLNLSDNSLKEVNPFWFISPSDYLEILDLSKNLLESFPIQQFPNMTHMNHLVLSENHLIDVNEDLIMEKCTTLKHFEFQFNYIGCTRNKELQAYFTKAANIDVTFTPKLVSGSNQTQFSQDGGCIVDGHWASLKLIEQNKSSKAAAKDMNNVDIQQVKDEIQNLKLQMIIISCVCFVTIIFVSGVLAFFIRKLWKISTQRHGTPDNRSVHMQPQPFNMYDGEYYEPLQTFQRNSARTEPAEPSDLDYQNQGACGTKESVYALVNKEGKEAKQE